MNSTRSSINLSITLLMFCLFVLGCSLGGGNTNNTTSNTGNQSGTGNSPTTTNVSPQPSPASGNVWLQTAQNYRGRNGEQFNFTCSPNGQSRFVWGTDIYSDDSSVCTAAVHAGVITLAQGGQVTIEIRPGQTSYAGSQRNGVTSSSYGTWSGSFVFVRPR